MKNLNEFHEEVGILGIKFSREVPHGLVKIFRQWVLFPSNRKLFFTYLLYMFSRRLHIRTLQKPAHRKTTAHT
jgi:hypothetical protein